MYSSFTLKSISLLVFSFCLFLFLQNTSLRFKNLCLNKGNMGYTAAQHVLSRNCNKKIMFKNSALGFLNIKIYSKSKWKNLFFNFKLNLFTTTKMKKCSNDSKLLANSLGLRVWILTTNPSHDPQCALH